MSRGDAFDVAVVGAGMVGSACAVGLARRGLRVVLIEERAPSPWRVGDDVDLRVVALAPSSVDVLRGLGVWDVIAAARVSPYQRMHVRDAASGAALDFDATDRGEAELGFIVENRLIQHALWQAAEADTRIERRCPARVVATSADGGRRMLELADGSRLAARLVLAADGANSPVRELAGMATHGRDYGQRAVVAHVATAHAHQATAWQRFLPGGPLAFLPLADGRSSIVWSLPDMDAARVLALDDTAFLRELGIAFDFRLGPVTATTPRAAFALRLQLAERYLAPRLALVGDAAHQLHPLAGQGVNLGFRDVAELIATLEPSRDPGIETTLRRYERRRRSDNTIAAHGVDALARIFCVEAMPFVALRGAGIRLINAFAPLKRVLADHAAGR